MAVVPIDPRSAAKGGVKEAAAALLSNEPQEQPPAVRPSEVAARQRRAERLRQATVARWLRQLSA